MSRTRRPERSQAGIRAPRPRPMLGTSCLRVPRPQPRTRITRNRNGQKSFRCFLEQFKNKKCFVTGSYEGKKTLRRYKPLFSPASNKSADQSAAVCLSMKSRPSSHRMTGGRRSPRLPKMAPVAPLAVLRATKLFAPGKFPNVTFNATSC